MNTMHKTIALSAAVGILGGVGITACLCRPRNGRASEEECETERHGLSSVESEEEDDWKVSTPEKLRPRGRSLPGAVPAVRGMGSGDANLQRALTFNIKSSPRRRGGTLSSAHQPEPLVAQAQQQQQQQQQQPAQPSISSPSTDDKRDAVSPSRLSASYLSNEAASLASRTVCSHLRRTRMTTLQPPSCQLDRS